MYTILFLEKLTQLRLKFKKAVLHTSIQYERSRSKEGLAFINQTWQVFMPNPAIKTQLVYKTRQRWSPSFMMIGDQ